MKLLTLPHIEGECSHPRLDPVDDDVVECIKCKKRLRKSDFTVIEEIEDDDEK